MTSEFVKNNNKSIAYYNQIWYSWKFNKANKWVNYGSSVLKKYLLLLQQRFMPFYFTNNEKILVQGKTRVKWATKSWRTTRPWKTLELRDRFVPRCCEGFENITQRCKRKIMLVESNYQLSKETLIFSHIYTTVVDWLIMQRM